MRGIDRVGLPVHIRVFFEGAIEDEGEGAVVEGFGLEEEFGLGEPGEERWRKEDVLSPNTQKTTDRRREMGHEFEPSAEVDALRPPS